MEPEDRVEGGDDNISPADSFPLQNRNTLQSSQRKDMLSPHSHGSGSVQPWGRVSSELVADCRIFKVRRDLSVDPRDGSKHGFYRIEAPDWINVVPLTTDDEVVMIEQYRHGTNEITLEIPGGMVDPGETPHEAANRELVEETGYQSELIELLAQTRPNPAIQNNRVHSFLARDCVRLGQPQLDGSEQISVRLVLLRDVPSLIANGTIDHALVVVAFYNLFAKRSCET